MEAPTPRRRRKDARPAELLDAALDTFREKGFAATRTKSELFSSGQKRGISVAPVATPADLLADPHVGPIAAAALKTTLLVFDYFHDVKALADQGCANARAVLQSWADAEWFTSRPDIPAVQKITVFKVSGETNTDDLSPAPDAWSRPDIPLHGLAMLKNAREGITPEKPGERGPI